MLGYLRLHRKNGSKLWGKTSHLFSEHATTKGKVPDKGFGFGLTNIVLMQRVFGICIAGIDLSDHLLRHDAHCLEESFVPGVSLRQCHH